MNLRRETVKIGVQNQIANYEFRNSGIGRFMKYPG
jgi:hypothetical protein